jgi:lipopolysaccharide/colanic/teichoic acid biosynthesis glycosyltransferase
LLIPGLPMIGLLVLAVRCTSRGPGIYRQTRVGRHGRRFKLYKIRTMRHNAEGGAGAQWTQVGDPRITPLGRVLRKVHLDELPQLWNVLKGEMALIGPRPERPEFVRVLSKEIPGYAERHTVRPGVTGLAQINLPPDIDLLSVRRKVVLDLEYIRHAGPLLDLRIFAATFVRLLGLPGALAMAAFALRRSVVLPEGPVPPRPGGNGELGSAAAVPVTPTVVAETAADEPPSTDGKAGKESKARTRAQAEVLPRPKPR